MIINMEFYVIITIDGMYHVQNCVMGMLGQHHVHNKPSYKKWSKGIAETHIHIEKGECNCGLNKSGDVRDHDGHKWHNSKFE